MISQHGNLHSVASLVSRGLAYVPFVYLLPKVWVIFLPIAIFFCTSSDVDKMNLKKKMVESSAIFRGIFFTFRWGLVVALWFSSFCFLQSEGPTVEGRNPAPVDM